MTIKEAQTAVDNWIKTYGVRYFSELTNMACLTEEVGELARVMATRALKPAKSPIWAKKWPMCSGFCCVWPIKQA